MVTLDDNSPMSERRYRSLRCRGTRFGKSLVPAATAALNKVTHWGSYKSCSHVVLSVIVVLLMCVFPVMYSTVYYCILHWFHYAHTVPTVHSWASTHQKKIDQIILSLKRFVAFSRVLDLFSQSSVDHIVRSGWKLKKKLINGSWVN